jgi:parallel beta-helix repeat protein
MKIQGTLFGVLAALPLLLPPAAGAATVDCNHGQSVARAVAKLRPGDTLVVKGRCTEHVEITEDLLNVTLDGQGTATIHGPDATRFTITVRGRGVRITGLTVSGGDRAIAILDTGAAVVENNTIRDAVNVGVHVGRNSAARIIRNTITNVAGLGINVRLGSGADIFDNDVSQNGDGIDVDSGGSADISGNRVFANREDGIRLRNNSHIRFSSDPDNTRTNVIEQNGGFGVSCIRGGTISGNPVNFGSGNGAGNTSIAGNCLVQAGVLP